MSKEDKTIKELKRVNHNLKQKYELLEIRYHALDDKCELLKEDISNYVKITLHDRKEIDRLNNIINISIDKVQEVKDHIDKSKFDGTTKSILIMALNEIIYSLNGKGVDKE